MENGVKDAAEVFKALGDATRLKILKEIAVNGNNLCVMAVAQRLGISQPAVSQHLKVLKNAGLVEAEKQGFHMHYQIIEGCMDRFGIATEAFLQSIGVDIDPEGKCEKADHPEDCEG
ncbi:MAG: winged helix-turn-helix transcriptional regulator [Spirochaetales bacterium]|nr:winged helix-turn-helix transcriptional regulator [Spirochaetales bacterium]